jgi:predicted RNA binding protein YcfA (HicA-like mRNA interferase family)
MPRPSGFDMMKFLQRQGFVLVRVRGSNHYMERGSQRTSIPVHGNRPIKTGTLRSVLRDIEMTPTEFADLWWPK